MVDDKEKDGNGRSLTGGLSLIRSEVSTFDREDGIRMIGKLKLRGKTDDLPSKSWRTALGMAVELLTRDQGLVVCLDGHSSSRGDNWPNGKRPLDCSFDHEMEGHIAR